MTEKITFIKKDDGDPELSCEECVFGDICVQTENFFYVFPECKDGEYWVIGE